MKHQLTGEGGKGSNFRDHDPKAYRSNLDGLLERSKQRKAKRKEAGCNNLNNVLCECEACKSLEGN